MVIQWLRIKLCGASRGRARRHEKPSGSHADTPIFAPLNGGRRRW